LLTVYSWSTNLLKGTSTLIVSDQQAQPKGLGHTLHVCMHSILLVVTYGTPEQPVEQTPRVHNIVQYYELLLTLILYEEHSNLHCNKTFLFRKLAEVVAIFRVTHVQFESIVIVLQCMP